MKQKKKGERKKLWSEIPLWVSSAQSGDRSPQLGGSDLAHHQARKSRKRLGSCYALVSNWCYLQNDYSTWPSLLPILNMVRTPSIRLFPPHRRKSLFASPSVVSEQFSELHRGRHLFPSTSNFKFAAFLSEWTINCLFSLTDARTLSESQVLSQQMQGSKNLFSNTRQGGSNRKVLVAKVAV